MHTPRAILAIMTFFTFSTAATAFAGVAEEKAAAELLDERLKNESPADRAILKAVAGKDVVVVAGSMDHIEQVLAAANIRHTVIQPAQVSAAGPQR